MDWLHSAFRLVEPAPSSSDYIVSQLNYKKYGVDIPYYIYGKKQMYYNGIKSNTGMYIAPINSRQFPFKLRQKSWE